ncbi:MAG TPA: ATP-binding cassette domain-containing protein, partial [Phycisphaerales bacterium]|nr:ATP-binding cassette domain-containing protein [Phycisphaerales bacterium]
MISIEQISFGVGKFQLRRFSIEIADAEYLILLGPPGSGKTVFLELICGLKRLDSGRICIDGRDVTNLEPRLRGIGYVPQD